MAVEVERWSHLGNGRTIIHRIDGLGQSKPEMIRGKTEFTIAPEERRVNQAKCAPGLDPFTNGTFIPVTLIETEADVDEIKNSPDTLGEDEMDELLNKHWKQLQKRLDEITSPVALAQFESYAEAHEAGPKSLERIRARLNDAAPDRVKVQRATRVDDSTPSDIAEPQEADIYAMGPAGMNDGS